jgi:hypothetical protein
MLSSVASRSRPPGGLAISAVGPAPSTIARSIAFSSSRTLPGQNTSLQRAPTAREAGTPSSSPHG